MEFSNSFWPAVIAAFAAGCALGAVLFGVMSRGSRDARKLNAELEKAEQKFEAYKASVADHFNTTSELVNDLTQDYVKVYKHLSEGAHRLGDSAGDMRLLEQQKGRVFITLPDATKAPETDGDDAIRDAAAPVGSTEKIGSSPDARGAAKEGSEPIDETSREYISETIREAADIADKIDDRAEPAQKSKH